VCDFIADPTDKQTILTQKHQRIKNIIINTIGYKNNQRAEQVHKNFKDVLSYFQVKKRDLTNRKNKQYIFIKPKLHTFIR
jgi:hypothetical protein